MPPSFDDSSQDDLIRKFWRFITGKKENNDPFSSQIYPDIYYDLPSKLYESFIFYQANFEEIDQSCFDRVEPSYLLYSTPWNTSYLSNSIQWNSNTLIRSEEVFLNDDDLNNDISLKDSISVYVNQDVKNTFNLALINFTEQSWIGKSNLPSINYISYKLPLKIYFDLEEIDQSLEANLEITNYGVFKRLNKREEESDIEIAPFQRKPMKWEKDLFIDSSPPILTSSIPADNATEVPIASNIVLNFSEVVDVESGNIVIHKSSDNSIVELFLLLVGRLLVQGQDK